MKSIVYRYRRYERGQGIVEFALALPILLVFIFVTIEIAHIVVTYNLVAMASREASRFAAGMSQTPNHLAHWQDCQDIRASAKGVASILGLQDRDIHIYFDGGPGTTQTEVCNPSPGSQPGKGDRVTVKVIAYYSPIVPVIQITPVPIISQSSHTILDEISVGN